NKTIVRERRIKRSRCISRNCRANGGRRNTARDSGIRLANKHILCRSHFSFSESRPGPENDYLLSGSLTGSGLTGFGLGRESTHPARSHFLTSLESTSTVASSVG